jgi:hypothetical protein
MRTLNLLKDWSFAAVLGGYVITRGVNQFSSSTLDQLSRDQRGTASVGNSRETYWSSENYFTYNKDFGEIILLPPSRDYHGRKPTTLISLLVPRIFPPIISSITI